MEADQSFEEDDEDDYEEEEEEVRTSKKRSASSPAIKSQVCFTSFYYFSFKLLHIQVAVTLFFYLLTEKNENGRGGR